MIMTMNINNMGGREDAWDIRRDTATDETNSNADVKKKRTRKKPKDKPMRPLSAYNMFFQKQRERIIAGKLEDPTPEEIEASVTKLLNSKARGPKRRQDRISHGQISFGDLARTIATKWKAIDPNIKAIYNKYAGQEKIRYKKEVVVWKEKKEKEHDAKMMALHDSLLNSSTSLNDSVRSLASSATSLPASLTSSFNPSDSVSSLGPHSGGGLPQDNMIQRQLRQQMGFIDSKPHARIGGGGNDSVARKIPNLGMQSFQFSRRSGDDSGRSLTSANLDTSSSDQKFAHIASDISMLDGLSTTRQIRQQQLLQHQLQQEQQHQLLLKLQEKLQQQEQQHQLLLQLQETSQQLRQLQQARNENSRLGDMDYTNLSQLRSFSVEQTNYDQFRNLEQVTEKSDYLKQQQRRMQLLMKEHQDASNTSLQLEDVMLPDDGTRSTMMSTSHNASGYSSTTNNSSFTITGSESSQRSFFGNDSRQRIYGSLPSVSHGGQSLGRGHASCPTSLDAGKRIGSQERRRNSDFETGANDGIADNFGHASLPSSVAAAAGIEGTHGHHIGRNYSFEDQLEQHQQLQSRIEEQLVHEQEQLQNRRSLAALLQLEEDSSVSHRSRQHQPQSKQDGLAAFLQSQGTHINESDDEIESLFKQMKDSPPK